MSRTTRLRKTLAFDSNGHIVTYFRHSPYQEAKQRAAERAGCQEWVDHGYAPRKRHTCKSFPHYLCSWEDVYPSIGCWVSHDSYSIRRKPEYCRKKHLTNHK